jgi:beta-glucosidase
MRANEMRAVSVCRLIFDGQELPIPKGALFAHHLRRSCSNMMKTLFPIALVAIFLLASCATLPIQTSKTQTVSTNRKVAQVVASTNQNYPFQDPDRPIDERVKNLVSLLTLSEKVGLVNNDNLAIPRLGVPEFDWHNEAAHGLKSYDMKTTNFPQVIGLAATWNPELMKDVSSVISDETRAAYNIAKAGNFHGECEGLTLWAPNINIFRDPRWGRGQETFGEDPFLTSRLSVPFIKGLQGDNEKYWKVVATAKHFAVYSGPESTVSKVDIEPTKKDFHETYLPAFEAAVTEGHAHSIMCAYTSLNGAPACANAPLITGLLRNTWKFDGAVVSDCGAIRYIWSDHKYTTTPEQGVVEALRAGTDVACQGVNPTPLDNSFLENAVKQKTVGMNGRPFTEAELDVAVARVLSVRFHLGTLDPEESDPFAGLSEKDVNSDAHKALSLESARQSLVLLKNQKHLLPLSKSIKQISIIGPNADNSTVDSSGKKIDTMLGTYHGDSDPSITPLEGIRKKVSAQTKVVYNDGSGGASKVTESLEGSDVAILVLGLQAIEDDVEGEFPNGEGEGHDRPDGFGLPAEQEALIKTVQATGIPMVVVLLNGSALASVTMKNTADAILEAWYPGQQGGTAIADVLFGDYNPAGRLPITFYKSTKDLPAFEDYKMEGRTYRYFKGEPLFAFGFGLSYTHFKYSRLKFKSNAVSAGQDLKLSVDVENYGELTHSSLEGDEVVQVYVNQVGGANDQPIRSLKAFKRIHLKKGEKRTVKLTVKASDLTQVFADGHRAQVPGEYTISVGGQQPNAHAEARTVNNVLEGKFRIIQ